MKGFFGFLATVFGLVLAVFATKVALEIVDSSAKKYYSVDKGF